MATLFVYLSCIHGNAVLTQSLASCHLVVRVSGDVPVVTCAKSFDSFIQFIYFNLTNFIHQFDYIASLICTKALNRRRHEATVYGSIAGQL